MFYDLELLFESKETSEVRAHIYSGRTTVDITRYKGAKRVFVEAEPGEYKFSVVAKLPHLSEATKPFAPKYVEFQLYAISAEAIPSRILRPDSLNYYGLLGPNGKGFGQFTYQLDEVILDAREFIDLTFNLSSSDSGFAASIDVQAIETDNKGDQLDISLREFSKGNEQEVDGEHEGPAANYVEKHPQASKYQDGWEDGVAYEALSSSDIRANSVYRVRLGNRDPAELARCALKVVVTEHFESEKQRSDHEVVP